MDLTKALQTVEIYATPVLPLDSRARSASSNWKPRSRNQRRRRREIVIDRFTVWGPVLVAKLHCPAGKVLEVRAEMTGAIDEVFGDMGFGEHPAPRVMYKDSKSKGEKEEGEEEEESGGKED